MGVGNIDEEVVDKLIEIKALNGKNIVQLECGECCSFAVAGDGKYRKAIMKRSIK